MTCIVGIARFSNYSPRQSWASLSAKAPSHCPLLANFRDSLIVKGALLEELVGFGSEEERILGEVKDELANFASDDDGSEGWKTKAWAKARRLESLLTLAIPTSYLYPELQYRLAMAENAGVKNVMCLNKRFQQLTASVNLRDVATWSPEVQSDLRFLLLGIVEETQRERIRKHLSQIFLKETTRQLLAGGLVSCLLFMLPYLILRAGFTAPIWSVVLPMWTCLAAGLFGAYFSRLLYIQKMYTKLGYEELLSSKDTLAVLLRGSIGVCGAALLFFLSLSGVVQGSFIPQATIDLRPDLSEIASKNLALLFVWGFFAGFSERLVPNILATTERSLTTADSAKPTRTAAG